MARHESDKEDLLREATALVERVELTPIGGRSGPNVVAGFRQDGAASIFFGADPVFHFNAAGELRRAYCDGLLFKAARGRLVSLRRVRQPDQITLLRHELSEAEQRTFMARMREFLLELSSTLNNAGYDVVGQVPRDVDVVGRLKVWLTQYNGMKIAATAHARPPAKRPRQ